MQSATYNWQKTWLNSMDIYFEHKGEQQQDKGGGKQDG